MTNPSSLFQDAMHFRDNSFISLFRQSSTVPLLGMVALKCNLSSWWTQRITSSRPVRDTNQDLTLTSRQTDRQTLVSVIWSSSNFNKWKTQKLQWRHTFLTQTFTASQRHVWDIPSLCAKAYHSQTYDVYSVIPALHPGGNGNRMVIICASKHT